MSNATPDRGHNKSRSSEMLDGEERVHVWVRVAPAFEADNTLDRPSLMPALPTRRGSGASLLRVPSAVFKSPSKKTSNSSKNTTINNSSSTGLYVPSSKTCCVVPTEHDNELRVLKPEGLNRYVDKYFSVEKVVGNCSVEGIGFDAERDDPITEQEVMYGSIEGSIKSVLEGHKFTIIAYGACNTGKTFTMFGLPDKCPGIVPRAVETIFDIVEETSAESWNTFFNVEVSYAELYNNKFVNLLKDKESASASGENSPTTPGGTASATGGAGKVGDAHYPPTDDLRASDVNDVHNVDLSSGSFDLGDGGGGGIDEGTGIVEIGNVTNATFNTAVTPTALEKKVSKYALKNDKNDMIEIHESSDLGCVLTGPKLRFAVSSAEQAMKLISKGNSRRSNRINSEGTYLSSRSHAIVTFYIEKRVFQIPVQHKKAENTAAVDGMTTPPRSSRKNTGSAAADFAEGGIPFAAALLSSPDRVAGSMGTDGDTSCFEDIDFTLSEPDLKVGRLHIVDLAGTERQDSFSRSSNVAQQEMHYINLSLLALSDVITALAKNAAIIKSQRVGNSSGASGGIGSKPGSRNNSRSSTPRTRSGRSNRLSVLSPQANYHGDGGGGGVGGDYSDFAAGVAAAVQSLVEENEGTTAAAAAEQRDSITSNDGSTFGSPDCFDRHPINNSNSTPRGLPTGRSSSIHTGMGGGGSSGVPRSRSGDGIGDGSGLLHHVPYLNSKLTTLLKESLNGASKTLLLVTIRPTYEYYQQTLASLSFATTAMKILTGEDGAANNLIQHDDSNYAEEKAALEERNKAATFAMAFKLAEQKNKQLHALVRSFREDVHDKSVSLAIRSEKLEKRKVQLKDANKRISELEATLIAQDGKLVSTEKEFALLEEKYRKQSEIYIQESKNHKVQIFELQRAIAEARKEAIDSEAAAVSRITATASAVAATSSAEAASSAAAALVAGMSMMSAGAEGKPLPSYISDLEACFADFRQQLEEKNKEIELLKAAATAAAAAAAPAMAVAGQQNRFAALEEEAAAAAAAAVAITNTTTTTTNGLNYSPTSDDASKPAVLTNQEAIALLPIDDDDLFRFDDAVANTSAAPHFASTSIVTSCKATSPLQSRDNGEENNTTTVEELQKRLAEKDAQLLDMCKLVAELQLRNEAPSTCSTTTTTSVAAAAAATDAGVDESSGNNKSNPIGTSPKPPTDAELKAALAEEEEDEEDEEDKKGHEGGSENDVTAVGAVTTDPAAKVMPISSAPSTINPTALKNSLSYWQMKCKYLERDVAIITAHTGIEKEILGSQVGDLTKEVQSKNRELQEALTRCASIEAKSVAEIEGLKASLVDAEDTISNLTEQMLAAQQQQQEPQQEMNPSTPTSKSSSVPVPVLVQQGEGQQTSGYEGEDFTEAQLQVNKLTARRLESILHTLENAHNRIRELEVDLQAKEDSQEEHELEMSTIKAECARLTFLVDEQREARISHDAEINMLREKLLQLQEQRLLSPQKSK